ncbi:putative lipoprotein [Leptospira broomii serovar Hurstbridge str. 5399]|uniref:Lipoprotein n=1 Tax=Leptospira broomii serovar Hurstbridge str. 5399 TaxID=1049789 RepID=T0F0H6_9LEPT|nr:lipoprotein LenA [Leptospira broomii]EQA44640.1 putative lipoprotein [Leptospira broomii serovar Hurstbridge str. 5399]
MKITSNILSALVVFSIFTLVGCKKEVPSQQNQIVGTKYSGWDQWIYKNPGSTSKADQASLVYGMEEVSGIEIVTREETDKKGNKIVTEYLKLKTVDNKEGFAPAKNFFDAILFVVSEGDQTFAKNSLTSPSKGKLQRGMYCLEVEASGDFAKVRCYGSIVKGGKLTDIMDVWIQPASPNISKDPLLGDTLRNLRSASAKLIESAKTSETAKQEELKSSAAKLLKSVAEKGDQFLEDANSMATEYGLTLNEQ